MERAAISESEIKLETEREKTPREKTPEELFAEAKAHLEKAKKLLTDLRYTATKEELKKAIDKHKEMEGESVLSPEEKRTYAEIYRIHGDMTIIIGEKKKTEGSTRTIGDIDPNSLGYSVRDYQAALSLYNPETDAQKITEVKEICKWIARHKPTPSPIRKEARQLSGEKGCLDKCAIM